MSGSSRRTSPLPPNWGQLRAYASHVADQEHAEPEDEPSGDPVVYDPNASEVRHV